MRKLSKETQKVHSATVGFDHRTGVSTITIKDKKLFPYGLRVDLKSSSAEARKIRQVFSPLIQNVDEWISEANVACDEVRRLLNSDSIAPHTALLRSAHQIEAPVLLGVSNEGEWLTFMPFEPDVQREGRSSRVSPENLLIHGPAATGKTVLLNFLYWQFRDIQPLTLDLVKFDLQSSKAMVHRSGTTNSAPEVMDALTALEELYTTGRRTVVFVDEFGLANGKGRVVSGALESLLRSRENEHLSFVVAKQNIKDYETRYYSHEVEARIDDHRGLYQLTLPAHPEDFRTNLPFRTPSFSKMIGS